VSSFKRLFALSFVVAAMATPGAYAAEPAPTGTARVDESVRCFVSMSMLIQADDAETKNVGQMGALYFMGRLDSGMPDKDLEERIFAVGQSMEGQDVQKVIQHCGEIMQERGEAVQKIGERVAVREQAAAAAKPK
jgi:hypothetical protein